MSNSRFYILEKSYRLFLYHNLEKVTISELEKETKKTRGTIFYHFNDKINLFNCIVNEIFLPQFNMSPQLYDTEFNPSLLAFIEAYKSPEERAINIIRNKYQIHEAERCYFNFLSQAYKYSPNFQERYTQVFLKEMQILEQVINKGKKNNLLIDCDPHILAYIVMFIRTGVFYTKGHVDIPELDNNISLNFYKHLTR